MTKRIAIGMSHPAGRSRRSSEKGRRCLSHVSGGCAVVESGTHLDHAVVVYRQQRCRDDDGDSQYVPC